MSSRLDSIGVDTVIENADISLIDIFRDIFNSASADVFDIAYYQFKDIFSQKRMILYENCFYRSKEKHLKDFGMTSLRISY